MDLDASSKATTMADIRITEVLAEEASERNLLAPVSCLLLELVLLVFAYIKTQSLSNPRKIM